MALFIWQKNALEIMAKIEGEDWLRHVKDFGDCGFEAFFNEWKKLNYSKDSLARMQTEDPRKFFLRQTTFISFNGNSAIYGYWGWNRYLVSFLGEIIFNEAFCADKEKIEQVKSLGIRLFSQKEEPLPADVFNQIID
jgi:hypothetical protein